MLYKLWHELNYPVAGIVDVTLAVMLAITVAGILTLF